MLRPQANSCREVMNLDGFWGFAPDPNETGLADGWAETPPRRYDLAVPASWNEQIGALYHFFGLGWYHRDVFAPRSFFDAGRRVFLHVGAVNQDATVWVNGEQVARHVGGHLPFVCDVTEVLRPEQANRVVICVDNRLRPMTLPSGTTRRAEDRLGFTLSYPDLPFDFFAYGGIHRSVDLCCVNATRVEAVRVETDYRDTTGLVHVRASIVGDGARALRLRLDGRETTIPCTGETVEAELEIPEVKLWDVGRPNLYSLDLELLDDDSVIDCHAQSVGVRTVSVTETEILLNGKPIWLRGFGKHEDADFQGRGVHRSLLARDFDLMHWIGANSFRTSHYPYDEAWYDFADRQGILVIGETPFVSLTDRVFTDELREHAVDVIRRMIDRDANHPSVIAWSVANEPYLGDNQTGDDFFRVMAETARAADPTRPVCYVAHQDPDDNHPARHFDFLGVNKYFGWYIDSGRIDETLGDLEDCLRTFHETYKMPILLSEFGADANAGFHQQTPVLFSEEFQAEILTKQYELARRLPFMIGAHVWNFADFNTAQQINRMMGNRKGVFTRDRKPKLAAHVLRAKWTEEPDTRS